MPQDHTTTQHDPSRRLSRLKVHAALCAARDFAALLYPATARTVARYLPEGCEGSADDVRRHLEDLVARGKAEKVGRRYRAVPRD